MHLFCTVDIDIKKIKIRREKGLIYCSTKLRTVPYLVTTICGKDQSHMKAFLNIFVGSILEIKMSLKNIQPLCLAWCCL